MPSTPQSSPTRAHTSNANANATTTTTTTTTPCPLLTTPLDEGVEAGEAEGVDAGVVEGVG